MTPAASISPKAKTPMHKAATRPSKTLDGCTTTDAAIDMERL